MQSPLVNAYFALVDASGLSDEEFERRMEAAEPVQIEDAETGCLELHDAETGRRL